MTVSIELKHITGQQVAVYVIGLFFMYLAHKTELFYREESVENTFQDAFFFLTNPYNRSNFWTSSLKLQSQYDIDIILDKDNHNVKHEEVMVVF